MQSDLTSTQIVIESDVSGQALPTNFHDVTINTGNLTSPEAHQNNGDIYYTYNGEYSTAPNVPLLPQSTWFSFSTSLGRAKGVIWMGGPYTNIHNNDPLVLRPTQLNAGLGAEPAFNGTYPLLPVALLAVQNSDGSFTNHMTIQTGQYFGSESNGILRLFSNMEFMAGVYGMEQVMTKSRQH
jgi:hypothetical protein